MAQSRKNLQELRLLLLYPRLSPRENPDKITLIGGAQRIIYELAVYLRTQGARVFLASADGATSLVIQNLKKQGIQHVQAPLLGKTPWEFLQAYRQLSRVISQEQINLIDSHHRWSTILGFLLSKCKGPAFIHHAHSVFNNKVFFKRFMGENIIAVSEGVKRNLVETFQVTPEQIQVIHNGISIERADPGRLANLRARLGLSPEDRVLSVIARISRVKGHKSLIQALPKIREKFPAVKLLFVGAEDFREPGLKRDLQRQAAELKVQDLILFLGHQEDIAAFIGISEFVILPSLKEGFPIVALECQVMGKAVVASDVGGVSEVITPGLNGLIVEPGDVAGLAQAVTDILSHPERARQMGAAGKQVAKKFSLERMLKEHSEYYQSLLRKQVHLAG